MWFKKISRLRIDEISVSQAGDFFLIWKELSRQVRYFLLFFKKARKGFPAKRGNFYHIKEETFLVKWGIFIIASLTKEIFIHIFLHSQKKTLFYCDCAISRQETKDIRSVFFCVLSFDHLLDKTIVTDK